mgnify:CR=1 FL=1
MLGRVNAVEKLREWISYNGGMCNEQFEPRHDPEQGGISLIATADTAPRNDFETPKTPF